jgi:hypothetical protein
MIQTKPGLDAQASALVQEFEQETFSTLVEPPARKPVILAQLIREGRQFVRPVHGTWDCPLAMAGLALGLHIPNGDPR